MLSARLKVPAEGFRPEESFPLGFIDLAILENKCFLQNEVSFVIFRSDHGLGPEGSMGPPGQSNMVPSNSDPSMYSPNRYPGQQR